MLNQSFPIGGGLFNEILAMASYNRTQSQGVYFTNGGALAGLIATDFIHLTKAA